VHGPVPFGLAGRNRNRVKAKSKTGASHFPVCFQVTAPRKKCFHELALGMLKFTIVNEIDFYFHRHYTSYMHMDMTQKQFPFTVVNLKSKFLSFYV
jgi:hypothetical protein